MAEQVVWYAMVLNGLILLVLLFFIIWIRKQDREKWHLMEEKDFRFAKLTKTIEDLREELLNKRNFFRLSVMDELCQFEIANVEDESFSSLLHKKGTGKIWDLSMSGMGFSCDVDLPIRKKITLEIRFRIGKDQFSLKGIIIRKSEHIHEREIVYGIEFLEMPARERARLVSVLNRIKAQRKKMTPEGVEEGSREKRAAD